MYSTGLNIKVTENNPIEMDNLVRVVYSLGVEVTQLIGEVCATSTPCGRGDELTSRLLVRGWGDFQSANTINLDILPSGAKKLVFDTGEGVLAIKANRGECFLWGFDTCWLKGSTFFHIGTIPGELRLANPNPGPIQLQVLIANPLGGFKEVRPIEGLNVVK